MVIADNDPLLTPYADNLEHLEALRREAELRLEWALVRKSREQQVGTVKTVEERFPNPGAIQAREALQSRDPEDLASELERFVSERCQRESLSAGAGFIPNFVQLCRSYDLGEFGRAVLLLLFTARSSAQCRQALNKLGVNQGASITIGTLLSALCVNFRQQLEHRRFFSVSTSLMSRQLLAVEGRTGGGEDVTDLAVSLDDRIFRFILGDDNIYEFGSQAIRVQRIGVRLEQVILPDGVKEGVVDLVENYLSKNHGRLRANLENTFGYGTGPVIMLHGPSGTGKTLLAQAIGNHLGCPLVTVNLREAAEDCCGPRSMQSLLRQVFRESELRGGIVFFDECDDLFEDRSELSRALLIEIEQSRCITILATNRALGMDPALERRILLRVPFTLPEIDQRRKIWEALKPEGVVIDEGISFTEFARTYLFTGGLIKNSWLLAAHMAAAGSRNGPVVITPAILHHAARQQSMRVFDGEGLCDTHFPRAVLARLPLRGCKKEEIRRLAVRYRLMRQGRHGLTVVFSCASIETGAQAAEALADELGMMVREFDLQSVLNYTRVGSDLRDPVTQRRVSGVDYAFSEIPGAASMLLFLDHHGYLKGPLKGATGKELEESGPMKSFLTRLRRSSNLVCVVTESLQGCSLPAEFNVVLDLGYPSEEQQMSRWESQLGMDPADEAGSERLTELVERYPLHLDEIDLVARLAAFDTTTAAECPLPDLAVVEKVLRRIRGRSGVAPLFGNVDGGEPTEGIT